MSTRRPSALACAPLAALCLLAACRTRSSPAPGNDSLPVPEAPPSASAVAPAQRTVPTLVPELFAPSKDHVGEMYPVEGALLVKEGKRFGRITDEGVAWFGKMPPDNVALGENILTAIGGAWPDGVDLLYTSGNGRAPQPTFVALTGKGVAYTAAPGGGWGDLAGPARVGGSTLLVGDSMATGVEMVTVRGPRLPRKLLTPEQAGCKAGDVPERDPPRPAITPRALQGTPSGTLVSIGTLCEKGGPAAEVWESNGPSRTVDLRRFWKKLSYSPKLWRGSGDELFAYTDDWSPILHYQNGAFEALPELERLPDRLFVSPQGRLHAIEDRWIRRYESGAWVPLARLPERLGSVAMDKDTFWMALDRSAYKLREGPGVPVPEGCATPFVYLYEVSSSNAKDFTFPSTQKALSTFPEVSALGLVEFEHDRHRHLGVSVTSRAQGEALVAHVKATMPDESPRIRCYEPKSPRKIEMKPKAP